MTAEEFSNEFDVLYNNIASNQAPGLDEYEKSLFLTRAQNMIAKNYFNPANNTELEGFDQTPKRQIDFSTLMTSAELSPILDGNDDPIPGVFDPRAIVFEFPSTPLMVINEFGMTSSGKVVVGLPAPYQTYAALLSKPYQYPPKSQAWRLLQTDMVDLNDPKTPSDLSDDTRRRQFEVLTDNNISLVTYKVRYIRLPKPIILGKLSEDNDADGLTIEGYRNTLTPCCELDEELHWEILLKAVELATAVYKLGAPASDSEPQQAKEKANQRQQQRQ